MKKRFICLAIICLAVILTGCSKNSYTSQNGLVSSMPDKEPKTSNGVYTTHNPTPEEILNQTPNADIFLYKDAVVQNAKEIEWVKKLKLSKGELIGEIISQYKKGRKFEQGMATKLPIGTRVYKSKERSEVLLVEISGKYLKYLMLLEG